MPKSDGLKSLGRFVAYHYLEGEKITLTINGNGPFEGYAFYPSNPYDGLTVIASYHLRPIFPKSPPEPRPWWPKRLWKLLNQDI